MQAIQTKYIGPTNYRPSRVKAYSEAFPGGITTPWDHALNVEENHRAAALAFIKAKGWEGTWAAGHAADGKGMVFVCIRRNVNGRRWGVEAGRGITRNGVRVMTVRHEPNHVEGVGVPWNPSDSDEATHLFAACAGANVRDLLCVTESEAK